MVPIGSVICRCSTSELPSDSIPHSCPVFLPFGKSSLLDVDEKRPISRYSKYVHTYEPTERPPHMKAEENRKEDIYKHKSTQNQPSHHISQMSITIYLFFVLICVCHGTILVSFCHNSNILPLFSLKVKHCSFIAWLDLCDVNLKCSLGLYQTKMRILFAPPRI